MGNNRDKYLVIITGPTGVGKSDLCIALAQCFSAPIVSCDSRQLYKEMRIGTAVPTKEQLNAIKHYFIQDHTIESLYSVGDYERDVIELLDTLFAESDIVLMVGGTGLYIDAVCNGIDDMPSPPEHIREGLRSRVANGELPQMVEELKVKDYQYYSTVDKSNPQRIIRALEVIETTGEPYSSFRTGESKERGFKTIKIAITREREELYNRINGRVDEMVKEGLLNEAAELFPFRHYNALQTVGYQELFSYMSGEITLKEAIELIKRNSRRYAKRQMTWLRRDSKVHWLDVESFRAVSESKTINELIERIKEYEQ